MKIKIIFLIVFICFQTVLSQTNNLPSPAVGVAAHIPSRNSQPLSVYSGTQSLATSYSLTACGLNYVQVSNPLFKRNGLNFGSSLAQPATFTVTGLPPCAQIEKAFLYVGTTGAGTSFFTSITNPGNGNSVFPMTIVGNGPDMNWGNPGTYTYRSDVTPIIAGNGNYSISGILTSSVPATDDATGATLLIIYFDRTQSYTGSIVLADGCLVDTTRSAVTSTISGFDVCNSSSVTTAFMIVDELQKQDTTFIGLNSATPNYTQMPLADTPWEFISATANPVTLGQNSAVFSISNKKDTMAVLLAGLYYQTDCLLCPSPLTLAAVSTPSCLASGTVNVLGGVAPYTYAWTSSAQSGSVVTDLSAGIQTVTVSDALGCLSGATTVQVSTPAPSIAVNSGSVCIGFSVTLNAGNASSYTWSPAAGLNNTGVQSVQASPSVTTIYTVDYTNAQGCTGTQTAQVLVTFTQALASSSSTLCAGQSLNLSANSFTGAGYVWNGPLSYTSSVANPVIANTNSLMSGVYNLSVTSVPGCTTMANTSVTVFPLPSPTVSSNGPICQNFNLNLNSGGGTNYSWQGPNGFTSNLQNPTIANSSTLATGVYTLTASFATGCSQTTTLNALVRALPPASCAITSSNVCLGRTINFAATGGLTYQWSGPNSFTSNLQNPSIVGITLAANGTYTVLVTDASGCQATATTTLAALFNPTVSVTPTTVCYGQPATMIANGLGFYSWFGPNSYTALGSSAFVPVTNTLTAGVYTVVLISALNSCSAQATGSLSTIPLPTVSATGTIVCFNEPAILTASGSVNYYWTGPQSYTSAVQNATVPLTDSTTSGIYTVVGTAANTCTSSTTVSLGTIPLPTVTATGSLVCFNYAHTIPASGAVTYTWAGPSSYTASGPNAFIPAVNNAATGIYTVVGTAPNTCTNFATAAMTTMSLPIIVTTNTIVCLNEPAALLSNGGMPDSSGYTWTGPAGYTANTRIAHIASATNSAVTVYTVVGTAPNTCTNVATASLTTRPLPPVAATSTLMCYGYSYTIASAGANTYTWAGPANYSYVGQYAPVAKVDSTYASTYTVTGTGINGCTLSAIATLSTMPLPNITAVSDTVCFLQPATLLANGGINGGYSWTGPNNYQAFTQNAFIPSATSALTQTYMVVGTAPNTCTNYALATLSTFSLPLPTYTAPARVCFNSPITLQGAGAATYTWTGPYDYKAAQQNVTFPAYNMALAGTFTLSVIDSLGCFNYTTTNIGIDPLPNGRLQTDNNNKNCVPFCSRFWLKNAGSAVIVNTSWIINDVTFANDTFRYCAAKPRIGIVQGQFKDELGCSNTVTFAISANPTPTAEFTYEPLRPIEDMDLVNFTSQAKGDKLSGWNWFFINNDGFHCTSPDPVYTFNDAGSFEVAMVVENDWGCRDTVVKTIVVDNDVKIYVPNVFTPNGDGINETFQPKGRGIDRYDFSIYNRWGERVFGTTDFEKGWDGKCNGLMCASEVYVWKIHAIDVNGNAQELSGHVTLAK